MTYKILLFLFTPLFCWCETEIYQPDGLKRDNFGTSVYLYGEVLVVGAPGDDDYGSATGKF
jgi:hypothetical protein